MINIKKSTDNKFFVDVTAHNGKVISSSETLKSKQMALKNIFAMALQLNAPYFLVTDHTVKGQPKKIFFERQAQKDPHKPFTYTKSED